MYLEKHVFLTRSQIHLVLVIINTDVDNISQKFLVTWNHFQLLVEALHKHTTTEKFINGHLQLGMPTVRATGNSNMLALLGCCCLLVHTGCSNLDFICSVLAAGLACDTSMDQHAAVALLVVADTSKNRKKTQWARAVFIFL